MVGKNAMASAPITSAAPSAPAGIEIGGVGQFHRGGISGPIRQPLYVRWEFIAPGGCKPRSRLYRAGAARAPEGGTLHVRQSPMPRNGAGTVRRPWMSGRPCDLSRENTGYDDDDGWTWRPGHMAKSLTRPAGPLFQNVWCHSRRGGANGSRDMGARRRGVIFKGRGIDLPARAVERSVKYKKDGLGNARSRDHVNFQPSNEVEIDKRPFRENNGGIRTTGDRKGAPGPDVFESRLLVITPHAAKASPLDRLQKCRRRAGLGSW